MLNHYISKLETLTIKKIFMKFGVKLTTADKVGLGVAGAVVWTIGIIPSMIGGWILYHYRQNVKEFFLKRSVQTKVKSFLSYLNIK